MTNLEPGAYPITIRIKNGILLVQCGDLGITVSRNFDLIRASKDIGDLYFEVFRKVADEIERRKTDKRPLPSPTITKLAHSHEEKFDVTISVAAQISGFPEHTLRTLSKEELPCFKTRKGHRRYRKSDLLKLVRRE